MIVPKQSRLFIYTVLNNTIVDESLLKRKMPKSNLTNLFVIRRKCLDLMNNHNNLNSFIYIHDNGRIEEEINVQHPKYKFHPHYSLD
jgi:hypothetical protein